MELDTHLLQVSESIRHLNRNRADIEQQLFKNNSFTLVAQVAAFFQKCPQLALFRCVLTVEGISIFEQMLPVRYIVWFVLLAAFRLY